MLFGLRNVSQIFQQLMNYILRDFDLAFAYLDVIPIARFSTDEYMSHRTQLSSANIYCMIVKLEKCVLGAAKDDFLGCMLSVWALSQYRTNLNQSSHFRPPSRLISW